MRSSSVTVMTRLLYLYPEEWTGRRAREVHTLSTCVALARAGMQVVLVSAGGEAEMRIHRHEIAGVDNVPGLELVALSRAMGPLRSAGILAFHFRRWVRRQPPFPGAYVIHLKAAALLQRVGIPYLFEAHEIFSETRRPAAVAQRALEKLEKDALAGAAQVVATSEALAEALRARYEVAQTISVVPNAGQLPLAESVARADGPFVYAGSLADWKGLESVIQGAQAAGAPLKIMGGTEAEWRELSSRCDVRGVIWQQRVAADRIAGALAGSRAGLIPTLPDTGSGRYSCPMKLFDYARCGLPVISTALPALQSLNVGSWCTLVPSPGASAWAKALTDHRFEAREAEAARAWAGEHTWELRARALQRVLA